MRGTQRSGRKERKQDYEVKKEGETCYNNGNQRIFLTLTRSAVSAVKTTDVCGRSDFYNATFCPYNYYHMLS